MSHTPAEQRDLHVVSCAQGWQFYRELLEANARLEATNARLQATIAELQTALRKVAVLERMKSQLSRFVPATVTTNLASRLATCAAGGTILVGAETARRVRRHLPLQAMGKHRLKGLATAVPVYGVSWQEDAGAPRFADG